MTTYPIFDGKTKVGRACVWQEGLYMRIQCRCMPLCRKPKRLVMQSGENTILLGLCVPDGEEMSLLKRMPVRQVGDSKPTFHVEESRQEGILFKPGEPFEAITKLRHARLQICDGKYYVLTDV